MLPLRQGYYAYSRLATIMIQSNRTLRYMSVMCAILNLKWAHSNPLHQHLVVFLTTLILKSRQIILGGLTTGVPQ